ncbi:MAG: hypothetical protein JWM68_4466 [Verrucomicrobiales bacterium]|nr:hypothetical protein [Verrucomicrobiales bacterium]
MSEYKGKPSGKVASNKKQPGKQGDLKELGRTAGARKKRLSSKAGEFAVAGGLSRSR